MIRNFQRPENWSINHKWHSVTHNHVTTQIIVNKIGNLMAQARKMMIEIPMKLL